MSDNTKIKLDGTVAAAAARDYEESGDALTVVAARHGTTHNSVKEALSILKNRPDLFAQMEAGRITFYFAKKKTHNPEWRPRDEIKAERTAKILRMVEEGFHSEQIARELRLSGSALREILRKNGVVLREYKSLHVNTRKVIEETAHGLAGYAAGLESIDSVAGIPPDEARDLARQIGQSLRRIAALKRQLQEIADESGQE